MGWVPFKKSAIAYRNGQLFYRGRWYVNLTVQVQKKPRPGVVETSEALGIDLGLKSHMTDSEGRSVEAQQFYRDLEPAIAGAQRANKPCRVRALHAKVAHRRKDFLHKLSTKQARGHLALFVGNVNAQALAQTRMAKSVLDAGWSAYRTMLSYKCDDAGTWFKEVDESYSTQDCHVCGSRTGPKGREGLGVRRWTCSCCGTEHDRDANAACNIKLRGLAWLEGVFSKVAEARAREPVLNEDSGARSAMAAPGHGRPAGGIPVL